MINDQPIIFLETIKTDIIHSLQENGISNTGKIAAQIKVTGTPLKAKLELPGYLQFIKGGKAPNDAKAGQPRLPMTHRIKQWQHENGITEKASPDFNQSIKNPDLKPDSSIISLTLSEANINGKLNPLLNSLADEFIVKICDAFNQLSKSKDFSNKP